MRPNVSTRDTSPPTTARDSVMYMATVRALKRYLPLCRKTIVSHYVPRRLRHVSDMSVDLGIHVTIYYILF